MKKTKVTGVRELNKYIKDMKKFLKQPKKFFARSGAIGRKNVLKHFDDEKSQLGRWKPLKYRKGPILQDKGTLRLSINYGYDSKGAMVGSNLIYAATHNYGDKERGIPRRRFFWFDAKTLGSMEKAMTDLLQKL